MPSREGASHRKCQGPWGRGWERLTRDFVMVSTAKNGQGRVNRFQIG